MDLNQYIQSGILENYLLGDVTDQEKREVECLAKIYPEIREFLGQQEEGIELMARKLARPVPEGHKERVMTAISGIDPQKPGEVPIDSTDHTKLWKWVAAASVVLAMFSSYWYFNANQSINKLENSIADQQGMYQELLVESKEDSVLMAHLTNAETVLIKLAGTPGYKDEKASVFWNKETKETFVVLDDLTPAPEGLNYQLWAIVDGKPLDMGVYDSDRFMIDQIAINSADAFAITLEKEGGSETPNLDQLVVIGNV